MEKRRRQLAAENKRRRPGLVFLWCQGKEVNIKEGMGKETNFDERIFVS